MALGKGRLPVHMLCLGGSACRLACEYNELEPDSVWGGQVGRLSCVPFPCPTCVSLQACLWLPGLPTPKAHQECKTSPTPSLPPVQSKQAEGCLQGPFRPSWQRGLLNGARSRGPHGLSHRSSDCPSQDKIFRWSLQPLLPGGHARGKAVLRGRHRPQLSCPPHPPRLMRAQQTSTLGWRSHTSFQLQFS